MNDGRLPHTNITWLEKKRREAIARWEQLRLDFYRDRRAAERFAHEGALIDAINRRIAAQRAARRQFQARAIMEPAAIDETYTTSPPTCTLAGGALPFALPDVPFSELTGIYCGPNDET